MFCNKCGSQNDDSSMYCEACGSQLMGIGNTTHAVETRKRPNITYFMALAGVIVLAVIGGVYSLGQSDSPPPEAVLNNFLQSVENQNQLAALECIAPYERGVLADYIPKVMDLLEKEQSTSDYIESTDNALKNVEFHFDGMQYQSRINGDQAEVDVTHGNVSIKTNEGKRKDYTLPKDVESGIGPSATIILVKDSDRWYISITRTMASGYLEMVNNSLDRNSY